MLLGHTHTRANFPGDESRSKLSQRAKTNLKYALHLKSTLARPPIYNRPCLPWNVSPGNPVGITKPISFPLFANMIKSLRKSRKVLREPTLRQISTKNSWQKFTRSRNLRQNSYCRTHFLNCCSIRVICITLRHAERAKLKLMPKFIWKIIPEKIWPESCRKISQPSAKNWMQPNLHTPWPS